VKALNMIVAASFAVVSAAGPAAAEEADIFVTDVLIADDNASVTLNDALQIREVKVSKTGGRTTLRFPEYVTKRGKAYPQVTVHSKKAYDNIAAAVAAGQPSKEKAKSIKFRVGEPQLLRSETRKANVEITFNDAVSVTVGVLKSKRQGGAPYWIGYPSRRGDDGKYVNQVVVTNPKLKKAVEEAVIERFERAQSESGEEPAVGGEDSPE
jgi:DNA-binding cell septation regulator SpoVG